MSGRVPVLTTAPVLTTLGESQAPSGCMVVEEGAFDPSDNPRNIFSREAAHWSSVVTNALVVPLLFVTGAPGNILSALVFHKQGLRDRIHMCVFVLALADVIVLTVTFLLSAEAAYRDLAGPASFFISNFVGLTGFTWVSMFLSAVIASERCFCVVSPFKSRQTPSTRTMAIVIITVSLVLLTGMLAIAGHKHTTACVWDPATQKSTQIVYVTEYYLKNKKILDVFDIFVYSTALPFLFLLVIAVTTAVTAVTLKNVSAKKQRNVDSTASATTADDGKGGNSRREVALTKMLIATSVLFIVCLIPMLLVQISTFLVSDLSYEGHYYNLYSVLWNIIVICRCINSSTNFFVYYMMGSKFRDTLGVIVRCRKGRGRVHASDVQLPTVTNHSA